MDEATREALSEYIHKLFGAEDSHLANIRQTTLDEGLPQINVASEEGRLLSFLIRLANAKKVVEIGTLAGYSATWIARALPEDGKLITLERDDHHADVAQSLFNKNGLADRIEIRRGDALASLQKLSAEGPFDAVFIDANKDGYPRYLDWAIDNVRVGGLIMAHNTLWSGRIIHPEEHANNKDLEGLMAFNQRLSEDPRLLGTLIPMGDGLGAAVRVK
jgi:caffeoyl-CoA O-methyltransferase